MAKKIFSESEATNIIRRAAELQEANVSETYTPGVSEEDLQRIAKEVGISPEYLQKAMLGQVATPSGTIGFMGFGYTVERVVEGELKAEDFDVVAETFPTSTSRAGLTQIGRSIQGSVMAAGQMVQVTVTARSGRTRIKLRATPVLQLVFGIEAFVFGLIAAIAGGTSASPIPIAIGAALATLGVWLLFFAHQSSHKKIEDLANKLAEDIAAVAEVSTETLANATPVSDQSSQTQNIQQ